ncbi:hypothetical protein TNCV_3777361 [Trichonephila clavipes]|nr:hypothetical protein TNCV_3777361 [Trichonephila clavipes]
MSIVGSSVPCERPSSIAGTIQSQCLLQRHSGEYMAIQRDASLNHHASAIVMVEFSDIGGQGTSRPDMPSTFSSVLRLEEKQRNLWKEPIIPDHIWYPESALVLPYSLKVIEASRLAYLDFPVNT